MASVRTAANTLGDRSSKTIVEVDQVAGRKEDTTSAKEIHISNTYDVYESLKHVLTVRPRRSEDAIWISPGRALGSPPRR